MTTYCCLHLATLACEVWHAHCQHPSLRARDWVRSLNRAKCTNHPKLRVHHSPVAPPTNTELGRVDARCCEVWSLHTSDSECSPAACVENIDSRLESLDEGLRLHDRLCVEEEGRDTAAMVTCKSRASLAATPAAFACESLATVACKSSAATSDIVACESAAAVACESSRRHPPPSPASPRSLSPASPRSLSPASPWSLSAAGPRSLSPARPRPPLPASHVRDHCEHPPRMRLNKRSVRGHRPPQGAFARAHSTLSLLLQNMFLLLLLPLLLWLPVAVSVKLTKCQELSKKYHTVIFGDFNFIPKLYLRYG